MGSITDDTTRFIAGTWDRDMPLSTWWQALADAGLAFPTWPEGLGGRGASAAESAATTRALDGAGVLGAPNGVGQNLAGPTLLAHATDEQLAAFLPDLANGQENWCQLFSEPGAGSDLASLQTRALVDGDTFIVNGQKVWSSGASLSQRGLLAARTDPGAPKHAGITFFVFDMDQTGVDVRPLRQMNGHADFDEVFLTDAQVGRNRIVGAPGGGWKVVQTTLAVERKAIGGSRAGSRRLPAGARNGHLARPVGELLDEAAGTKREPISGYLLGKGVMEDLAREMGRDDDPVIRQRLAEYRALVEVNRLTGARAAAGAKRHGRAGPESSIGKLAVSNLARRSRDLAMTILGPYGMLSGADAPHGGAVVHVVLSSFAAGLGGGTDEIQRNVIGERALGLPKEPDPDRAATSLPGQNRKERHV